MPYSLVKQLLNLCSCMIILCSLKKKAKAWGVKNFFIQNVQNRFTCEATGLQWTCRYVRWIFWVLEVVGKVPCSQLAPCLSLNLQFCCWSFEAPLNSEECLFQLLCGSSQWGFLSRVRPTEVTESKWKQRHSHEKPYSRKHHQELLSQSVPLCTPVPSQRMLLPACYVKHPQKWVRRIKYRGVGIQMYMWCFSSSEVCIYPPTYLINLANK